MSASSKSTTDSLNEVYKNKKVVNLVKEILCEIAEDNKETRNSEVKVESKAKKGKSAQNDPFSSKYPTSIPIRDYIDRILKYTHIEESTMVIALIYLDKICATNRILIEENNIHRLVLVSVVMAIKYNEDDLYTDKYYAKVGGITMDELTFLELEYVKLMNYAFFVTDDTFDIYFDYLKNYHKNKAANKM